jgi:hypothetical protein
MNNDNGWQWIYFIKLVYCVNFVKHKGLTVIRWHQEGCVILKWISYLASLQICTPATPQPTWLRPFKLGPRSRLALSQRYLLPFQTRHEPSRLGIIPQTNNKGCTGRLYLTGRHDRRYLRATFHTPSPDISWIQCGSNAQVVRCR